MFSITFLEEEGNQKAYPLQFRSSSIDEDISSLHQTNGKLSNNPLNE